MKEENISFDDELKGMSGLLPYFDLEQFPDTVQTKEALLDWLANELEKLSMNNFSGFLQLLYRIDVSEQKVKGILQEKDQPFLKLADTVLEREIQKKHLREKFKNSTNTEEEEETWN